MKKITFFALLLFFTGVYAQNFPEPYCDITEVEEIELITSVEFGDTAITNDNDEDILINETSTIVEVVPGQTYTISVEGYTGGDYDDEIVAFIDWNQNGTLDDEGEVFFVGVLTNSSGSDGIAVSTDIVVPEDAEIGETRIRITKTYGDEDSPALIDPCAISLDFFDEIYPSFGQALDFTLNILGDENDDDCQMPENIAIDDITEDSAFVIWEPGMDPEETQGWEVVYGPEGFDVEEEGTIIETIDPMLALEDLEVDTTYDVYVRTICDEDNSSEWEGPVAFTTEEVEDDESFPFPYCDIDDPMIEVEMITLIDFDDTIIENDNEVDVLIDATSTVISVEQGQTYTLKVEGFTAGNFDNYIVAFIDWNQNEVLDDEGEVYEVGVITNSTGEDGVSASIEITVPEDAEIGETRIRITKTYGDEDSPALIDPCSIVMDAFGMGAFASFGQAIDFTLDVGVMSVDQFDQSALKVYPVPTDNFLNIAYQSELKNVKIYNLLGQEVISENPNTLEAKIDVSRLAEGTYLVKLFTEEGTHNFKFIKK